MLKHILILLACAVTLTGCGGGSTSAPTPAPTSAAAAISTDDTAAVQAAVDAGGVVNFPAGTYNLSRTITVSKSGTVIQGTGAVFNFKPATTPSGCPNDAAFTSPCIDSIPRQQITQSIAIGDSSFTAAGDVSALVPGAWLVISERDNKYGDIVAYDWAQVESVSGQVVTVAAAFRTAFSGSQPFDPNVSGLGFIALPALVENVEFRGIMINAGNAVGIQVDGALNTTIDSVTVNANWQPLYSFLSKGLTVRNSTATGGRLSEFAATVDLQLTDSTFSGNQGAALGLDLGSGFFTINGIAVTASDDIGMYLFVGVHDGTVENNQVAYVNASTPGYDAVGLLGMGAYNCTVINNYFAGGAGAQSTGVVMGADDSEAVPVPATNNVTAPNTFGPGWSADY
jgi:hypothetical protein